MSLNQYLTRYAEPETGFADLVEDSYQHVLCIPAFAEPLTLLDTLLTLPGKDSILVILVVNAPAPCEDSKALNLTHDLLNCCRQLPERSSADGGWLLQLCSRLKRDLLLIDRCTPKLCLPYKEGVGLARKIAADLACSLISSGKIGSSWIYTSDADVTFPENYFHATENINSDQNAALILPYHHVPHQDLHIRQCQSLYDLALHYYVEGLRFANSPYAYHTLGSTLILNHQHYAQVRGYPKRSAAEDFYLLNKLAKTGKVNSLQKPILEIETRLSSRVPFGTGPALQKLMDMINPQEEYLFYHPDIFLCLQLFLITIPDLWSKSDQSVESFILLLAEELAASQDEMESQTMLTVFHDLKLKDGLAHAFSQSTSQHKFEQHFHHWFDGFKTLRFIHLLRDSIFPSQTLKQIEDTALMKRAFESLE